MIIFGSIRFLYKKKSNQINFFLKKTETELKPVQTDRFRFGFLGQKPVQPVLDRFFPIFSGFGSVFSVLGL